MVKKLVIKATTAQSDPERTNQAFTVAAAAAAAGADVTLWLTGDAAWYAAPERPEGCGPDLGLPHATPIADLLAAVLTAGTVVVCTQCAARRGLTEADLVDGATIAGAAVFAEQVLADDVQALVY
ncbi:DsrE family protein [Nocardioides acrostichi]|uniref:DsrE family protein n=1 Tax=Nocardioides acrostichi TaxID=2784339 RepID=A0A930UX86_9ACTN|nr:DsrE family protein [Nocardioides acrostichi]MBF4162558.1 DsrE family protein [Nocardioides acrostichi]